MLGILKMAVLQSVVLVQNAVINLSGNRTRSYFEYCFPQQGATPRKREVGRRRRRKSRVTPTARVRTSLRKRSTKSWGQRWRPRWGRAQCVSMRWVVCWLEFCFSWNLLVISLRVSGNIWLLLTDGICLGRGVTCDICTLSLSGVSHHITRSGLASS